MISPPKSDFDRMYELLIGMSQRLEDTHQQLSQKLDDIN